MPSSSVTSNADDDNACTLRIHGYDDEVFQLDRLLGAVIAGKITKLDIDNVFWSEILRDELQTILENTRFPALKSVYLRGGQGQHFPRDFGSLESICWRQIPLLPTVQIRYDVSTLMELSLLSLSLPDIFLASLARHLADTNAVIEKLDLTDSRMLRRGLNLLGNGLRRNTSLQLLCISECNLMDLGLGLFLHFLRKHPSLSRLDLSFTKCRQDGIFRLSRLLMQHSTSPSRLVSLDAGFLAFGVGRQVDVTPIIDSLRLSNTCLKILGLGGNSLRDETMSDLVAMLTQNQTLEKLDLSENQFTNQGIRILAEGLPNMQGLRYLDLEGNRFDQRGLQLLADATVCNQILEAIHLDETLARSSIGRRLGFYLDLNWGGQRFLLGRQSQSRPVPLPLWPLVLERAQRGTKSNELNIQRTPIAADIIFFFLKSGQNLAPQRSN